MSVSLRPPSNEALIGEMMARAPWLIWFDRLFKAQAVTRTFTFNPSSVSANSTSEQTVTVPGLEVGMVVQVNKPSHTSGLIVGNARVSAANTLAVTLANVTAGAIDAGEETWSLAAWRP